MAVATTLGGLAWSLQLAAGAQRMVPSNDIPLAATALGVIALGARGGLITLLACAVLQLTVLLPAVLSSPHGAGSAVIRFSAFVMTGSAICWIGGRLVPLRHTLSAKELRRRLAQVKLSSGLLPICAWCKKIPDNTGDWISLEDYLRKELDVEFTHGFCPGCASAFEPLVAEQSLHKHPYIVENR